MIASCKIKYRPNTNTKKYHLYLASFPNGNIRNGRKEDIEITAYENAQTSDGLERKKVRKIVTADTGRLHYSGSNCGTQISERGEMCKHQIGVLNKKTGVMKLYDVDLFTCNPILITNIDTNENDAEKSRSDKLDSLTSVFGSKKKKQAMQARHRYNVAETGMTDAVCDAVNQSNTQDDNLQSELHDRTPGAIPLRNNNPTSEEEVYNIYDIISPEELNEITLKAEKLKNASMEQIVEWKANSTYASYVLDRLELEEGDILIDKAKFLAYYDYMVYFFKLSYKELRRKDVAPEVPEPFKSNLVSKFVMAATSENGRESKSMPPRMKDKLIAYAIVLALFIEDFSLNLTLIQADFKVSLNRLTKIAYALGCHISRRKIDKIDTKFAELTLPLYVPKERPSMKKA